MKQKDDRQAVERMLDVVDALAGCVVKGTSNKSLSEHLNLTPSTTTRLLTILINRGWARKDEVSGLFHPTPRMARVFGRVLADIDKAEQYMSDIKRNFTITN